jgi:hypothetical protein
MEEPVKLASYGGGVCRRGKVLFSLKDLGITKLRQ